VRRMQAADDGADWPARNDAPGLPAVPCAAPPATASRFAAIASVRLYPACTAWPPTRVAHDGGEGDGCPTAGGCDWCSNGGDQTRRDSDLLDTERPETTAGDYALRGRHRHSPLRTSVCYVRLVSWRGQNSQGNPLSPPPGWGRTPKRAPPPNRGRCRLSSRPNAAHPSA